MEVTVRRNLSNQFNLIDLDLVIRGGQRLCLSAVYRPPDDQNFQDFLAELEISLRASRSQFYVLTGDLNVDVRGSGMKKNVLLDVLSSYGVQILNDKITRPHSGTLIDYFASNFATTRNYTLVTMETSFPTDHNALICQILLDIPYTTAG